MTSSCNLLCLIAAGLFGSMLYVMIFHNKRQQTQHMESLLDDNQKAIYRGIIKERLTIYIYGLLLGLLSGFTYISYYPIKNTLDICTFVVLILGIVYLFYGLYPKNAYMLSHLNTPQQTAAWMDIYRTMKRRCLVGFVLGAVAFLLFGYALKK